MPHPIGISPNVSRPNGISSEEARPHGRVHIAEIGTAMTFARMPNRTKWWKGWIANGSVPKVAITVVTATPPRWPDTSRTIEPPWNRWASRDPQCLISRDQRDDGAERHLKADPDQACRFEDQDQRGGDHADPHRDAQPVDKDC